MLFMVYLGLVEIMQNTTRETQRIVGIAAYCKIQNKLFQQSLYEQIAYLASLLPRSFNLQKQIA